MLDLFHPPKVRIRPTRVVRLADVEPAPTLVYRGALPKPVRDYSPRGGLKPLPKQSRYASYTPERRAEANRQSREWYVVNRERALAQAKARYAALSPEEKAALVRRNMERERAARRAKGAREERDAT
jgi:hypothetical protein